VRLVDGRLSAGNPLVLHGPAGVGKSALALALVQRHRERLQLDAVVCTTGAELAQSLAHAVETDSVADHRTRHHRCDLLLIDNLHRLVNKPAAQQFLISTLDALLKRGSLVIVTLSKSPSTLNLAPQLVSRLLGGLVVRLAPPGADARQSIVRQTATRTGLRLTESQIDELADIGSSSTDRTLSAPQIRQLVLRLAAKAEMGSTPEAVEKVDDSEHDLKQFKALNRRISTLVGKQFAIPVSELKSKSRRQAVADARGLAMFLVRRFTTLSYADVGRLYGGRDHTTVMHACRKVIAQFESDEVYRRCVEELIQDISSEGVT